MPEMTVYLDISAEKGLARLQNREFKDRLDQEQLSFHQMVEKGYHTIMKRFPERFRVVDASQPKEKVIEDAYEIVKKQILSHE